MAQKIKLTKLKDCEDPLYANHIPSGHEKIGQMCKEPVVGECFWVGESYRTSTVQEIIDENTFKTHNSIYKIEKL